MTLKVIFGLIIIAATTLAGVKLADKKKLRCNFYNEMVGLCCNLKSDLGYSRSTLDKIMEKLPPVIKERISVSAEQFISGKAVLVSDKRFSEEERGDIADFFNRLGTYDAHGSVNFIDYYYEKFKKSAQECEKIYKKTSTFYIKIGALLGALIYIIVI